MKYNAVIMLKEILKHTNQYLNDDVKQWIYKKALQGTKSDYWDILSITTNLFYYYLFRTDETINYKKFRLWFRQNPLYINNSNIDNYPDEFLNISDNRRDSKYKQYLNTLTFKKLYNKVREIEDHEIKYKFIIICDYLQDKIICGLGNLILYVFPFSLFFICNHKRIFLFHMFSLFYFILYVFPFFILFYMFYL